MTNQNQRLNPTCDDYAPLISAMIDGELESREEIELRAHLDHCLDCQNQVRLFGQVDSCIDSLSRPLHHNGHSTLDFQGMLESAKLQSLSPPVKKKQSRRNWVRSAWRMVPIAAAATILVCLAIMAIPSPSSATAKQISPEEITQPLKDLQQINLHQQRDQDLMLRTLVMDLRSMKLDIARLEPESSERQSLESKITALIDKVNHFHAEDNSVQ